MSNFLNPYKYNENQKEKFQKIYTYYPEFKKQINYKLIKMVIYYII